VRRRVFGHDVDAAGSDFASTTAAGTPQGTGPEHANARVRVCVIDKTEDSAFLWSAYVARFTPVLSGRAALPACPPRRTSVRVPECSNCCTIGTAAVSAHTAATRLMLSAHAHRLLPAAQRHLSGMHLVSAGSALEVVSVALRTTAERFRATGKHLLAVARL
jgi:hypothetical protein